MRTKKQTNPEADTAGRLLVVTARFVGRFDEWEEVDLPTKPEHMAEFIIVQDEPPHTAELGRLITEWRRGNHGTVVHGCLRLLHTLSGPGGGDV